jgi:nicotinamide riboside transporter PnuC
MLSLIQLPQFLAQTDDFQTQAPAGPGPVFWIVYCVVIILLIASIWKVFSKAGQPGWAAIIPIYNVYVMCKVAGRPGWWLLLMLIPLVNVIIAIILTVDISKNFGKGVGFAIGMIFLPFIFWPILGFGSAQYQGPAAGAPPPITPS